MKKLIFLFCLISPVLLAEGPIKSHEDPATSLEFENVYQDIREGINRYVPYSGADQNVDLGSNDLTSAGTVTQTGQPCFLVTKANGETDITGDGTAAVVAWDAEIYDVGGNFASNVFTAPVTGRYLLTVVVDALNITTSHSYRVLRLNASNRVLAVHSVTALAKEYYGILTTAIMDMDANDTVQVELQVGGSGRTVDIYGNATYNHFSGTLIN